MIKTLRIYTYFNNKHNNTTLDGLLKVNITINCIVCADVQFVMYLNVYKYI